MLHLFLLLALAAVAYYFYQANAPKPTSEAPSARSTLPTAIPATTAITCRSASDFGSCRTAVPTEAVVSPCTAVANTPNDIKWLKAEPLNSDVEMKAMKENGSKQRVDGGSMENMPAQQAASTSTAKLASTPDVSTAKEAPPTVATTPTITFRQDGVVAPESLTIRAANTTENAYGVAHVMPSEEQRHLIEGLTASTPSPKIQEQDAGVSFAHEPKVVPTSSVDHPAPPVVVSTADSAPSRPSHESNNSQLSAKSNSMNLKRIWPKLKNKLDASKNSYKSNKDKKNAEGSQRSSKSKKGEANPGGSQMSNKNTKASKSAKGKLPRDNRNKGDRWKS